MIYLRLHLTNCLFIILHFPALASARSRLDAIMSIMQHNTLHQKRACKGKAGFAEPGKERVNKKRSDSYDGVKDLDIDGDIGETCVLILLYMVVPFVNINFEINSQTNLISCRRG